MDNKIILIVDDEKDIRAILKKVLVEAGYAVQEAENGEAAIALLASAKFDLILLDLKMPGMDGLETLAEIRRRDKNIPVIIVSGYISFNTLLRSTELGISDYIAKPFEINDLRAKLQKVLGPKR